MLLGISLFSLAAVVSAYSEGFRILTEDGPRAALEFYQRSSNAKQDSMAEFGKAWSKFSFGKLAEAEQDCYRLIQSPNLSPSVRGNAHYLLGHIQLSQIRLEEARENFLVAHSIYQLRGKASSLFDSSLGLAEVAIEQGFLEDAEEILENTLLYEVDTDYNLGHFYHLHSRIAFLRQDYQYALEMSYESFARYQQPNRKDGLAGGLIDIGFYEILVGSYEDGYAHTMEAQEIIFKTGIERKYYFNLANFLLFNKCREQPIASLKSQIEQRILEEGTSELQNLLDLALQWECFAGFDSPKDRFPLPVFQEGSGGAPDPPPEITRGSDGAPNPPPPDEGAPR